MDNINYDYIKDYVNSLINEEDEEFEKFRQDCLDHKRPIIQREVAQFMKVCLNIQKPKRILEIGSNVGYSSMFMCRALGADVKITTIELNTEIAMQARENIKRFGYDDCITVINDDATDALDSLGIAQLDSKFDFVFIDASKSHYDDFFEKSLRIVSDDAVIMCDNTLYKGLIANDDLVVKRKRTIVRKMRSFLSDISDDDRFITSLIPIGDGVALIKIKRRFNVT